MNQVQMRHFCSVTLALPGQQDAETMRASGQPTARASQKQSGCESETNLREHRAAHLKSRFRAGARVSEQSQLLEEELQDSKVFYQSLINYS